MFQTFQFQNCQANHKARDLYQTISDFYVSNHTLNKHLVIPLVSNVTAVHYRRLYSKLLNRSNSLAKELTSGEHHGVGMFEKH